VSREQLCILASWFLSPMSKNSVLHELRVRRLAVIQEEMCWRAFWRWEMLESKLSGWKQKKSWVSSAQRWWSREREEIRVLRRVVYMTKS